MTRRREFVDSAVDDELSSLSKRLAEVGQIERISRDFTLSITGLNQFKRDPPTGTTLRTFRMISAAVAILESEHEKRGEGVPKK